MLRPAPRNIGITTESLSAHSHDDGGQKRARYRQALHGIRRIQNHLLLRCALTALAWPRPVEQPHRQIHHQTHHHQTHRNTNQRSKATKPAGLITREHAAQVNLPGSSPRPIRTPCCFSVPPTHHALRRSFRPRVVTAALLAPWLRLIARHTSTSEAERKNQQRWRGSPSPPAKIRPGAKDTRATKTNDSTRNRKKLPDSSRVYA